MIDTIVLTLQNNQFQIFDHSKFSPSTIGLFQAPYYRFGKRSHIKCVLNPTKEKGVYKPRLTVTRRIGKEGFQTTMRIEFSIPKLLFGNNFDEVKESQFKHIIKRLYDTLNSMSVIVAPHMLQNAFVSAIHYSKNIVLSDYSTPYAILKELSKINLNQKLDINQTDFRNEGHSLKFRANSYEISLYDKKKDLQKAKTSGKRAIEKNNEIQLELFDQWKPKAPFEVLRMEIRLNKRVKIKSILKKINIDSDLTFRSLFKQTISKKILLFYFEYIKKGYSLLSYRPKSSREFVAEFKINNPHIKVRKMLQIFALKKLIDEIGIREFRETIKPYGKHNWDRLKYDLSRYKFPKESFSPIKAINQSLTNFKPLRLKELNESNR